MKSSFDTMFSLLEGAASIVGLLVVVMAMIYSFDQWREGRRHISETRTAWQRFMEEHMGLSVDGGAQWKGDNLREILAFTGESKALVNPLTYSMAICDGEEILHVLIGDFLTYDEDGNLVHHTLPEQQFVWYEDHVRDEFTGKCAKCDKLLTGLNFYRETAMRGMFCSRECLEAARAACNSEAKEATE